MGFRIVWWSVLSKMFSFIRDFSHTKDSCHIYDFQGLYVNYVATLLNIVVVISVNVKQHTSWSANTMQKDTLDIFISDYLEVLEIDGNE